jgi:predicted O-methyltransferase YrrM
VKSGLDNILQTHVARYLEKLEPARDALLSRMEARAAEKNHPISDPEVASLLDILVRASRPKHLVEVGTNIGYGAIVLARAAGEGAHTDTVEKSAEHVKVAREFIAEAGLTSRITVHEDDALAFLKRRQSAAAPVDFAYIDCVKEDYPAYLDLLLPKMPIGGLIVADNVLWKVLVPAATTDVPENERVRVTALRKFNALMTTRPELKGSVLPLGDGIALAIKIGS